MKTNTKKAHTLKHHHKQSFPPSCPPQAWFSVSPVKLNTISILGFFWSALTCEFGCLISDQRHVRSYDHFWNNIIHKTEVLGVAGKPLWKGLKPRYERVAYACVWIKLTSAKSPKYLLCRIDRLSNIMGCIHICWWQHLLFYFLWVLLPQKTYVRMEMPGVVCNL